jgi:glutamate-5-semialdehyde dehydrogenase
MQMTDVNLQDIGERARAASRELARADPFRVNEALLRIAGALVQSGQSVVEANNRDVERARESGLGDHIVDRLVLDAGRLKDVTDGVRAVAALTSPVGQAIESRVLPNGVKLSRRRVPLGVIGVIYESRPNVTVDISALCLKSGNAVILRGGKESIETNKALAGVIRNCLKDSGLPEDAVQLIESTDRSVVAGMLQMRDYIDLLIPRGGAKLVMRVANEATMPAITGGIGVCHTYVDSAADLDMATSITLNAKVQRPSVCNALDTVLVHSAIAGTFLPQMAASMAQAGVELRCDSRALSIIGENGSDLISRAKQEDFGQEFLALVASVKVVDSLDDALAHIATYGSGHTEAIVTGDYAAATRFTDEVDAAAVFVNLSTRLNDGGEFGLGAEVAISTNKMHARGPMGLAELTSYKWVGLGSGQVREG